MSDILIATGLNGLIVFAAYHFAKQYFSSYIDQKAKNLATLEDAQRIAAESERGKNLATKEDIGRITSIVEEIKSQHAAELEAMKSRNQLRVAAIDKRLQAHQEAFALWRKIFVSAHESNIGDVVRECQDWWNRNCLYLEPEARQAFSSAYWAASRHRQYLDANGQREGMANIITTNWEKIENAGEVLVKAVSLPGLTEGEKTLSNQTETV